MKQATEKLLSMFRAKNLWPAKVDHCLNGKTRLVWSVDDDDDRYVELVDSRHTDEVVLVARDGRYGGAKLVVYSNHDRIFSWVDQQLKDLGSRQSDRGRKAW